MTKVPFVRSAKNNKLSLDQLTLVYIDILSFSSHITTFVFCVQDRSETGKVAMYHQAKWLVAIFLYISLHLGVALANNPILVSTSFQPSDSMVTKEAGNYVGHSASVTMFTLDVPQIYKKIFLSSDHESFKSCLLDNKKWHKLIISEAFQKMGKSMSNVLLCQASMDGCTDVVLLLLQMGADPEKAMSGKYESTALHWAAIRGHKDVVKVLLDGGADPDSTCTRGGTPLHHAAYHNHKDVVKLLIDGGANPNKGDKHNYSALHSAAFEGHQDVVKLLLDRGADPNITCTYGGTPLHYAAPNNHKDVVKLLLEGGADPNKEDKDEYSPLYYASFEGHQDVVKLLIDRGADPAKQEKTKSLGLKIQLLGFVADNIRKILHSLSATKPKPKPYSSISWPKKHPLL